MRHSFIMILLMLISTARAEVCEPTPSMHMGTHYEKVTQQKIHMGKGLHVSGRIRSARDCKPIAGAKISRWQTNVRGIYEKDFYAYMYADESGAYAYNAEWPGAPIPHLHFIVEANGHKTLNTQWIGEEQTDKIVFDIILEPE